MSADVSARTVRQADGLDPVRALQRVLYRSAKQDGTRRFHALFDKVARSDVMWRAWVDVATLRMPDDERCRRAVCGRTACTVR
jgi:RNA-directed DNA polymerase